ncbi:hypothetical protein TthSNM11_17690 [Thermus thermophilus]|nr:hypothetical protein TthSNM11_16410 [Thermus thermophilus]BDG19566.1 hypothetical protein TthSNM11_17690 [Thermus thermophilus]
MNQAALSLLWTILALMPTPHLRESLKALLFLFLTGHGKARPQHSKTKSPSALSRFLNRYPWPTRALIRLVREEAQKALDRARRRKGPKPRLLVVLDLVTLEKRGHFPHLPSPSFTASGASTSSSFTSSTGTSASPGPTVYGGAKGRRPSPSWP